MRKLLRRIFGPCSLVITPVAVRPGDDLVIAADYWPASQDIVGFLRAAQEQLPGVKLHLLVGFGGVQVKRNCDSSESDDSTNNGRNEPGRGSPQSASCAVAPTSVPSKQAAVVVLTQCAGNRIIATTVPPNQQGDSVEKSHSQAFVSLE